MKQCHNCLKMFPETQITIHFLYCQRNIRRCDTCGQMYHLNYFDEHEEQFHNKVACQYCKREFGPGEIEDHINHCHHKPKLCQYCQQKVLPEQFDSHLKSCESAAKVCYKCSKLISNKQFLIHMTTYHGLVKVEESNLPRNYFEAHINPQSKKEETRVKNENKPSEEKRLLGQKKGFFQEKKKAKNTKQVYASNDAERKVLMYRNTGISPSGSINHKPGINDIQVRRNSLVKNPSFNPSKNHRPPLFNHNQEKSPNINRDQPVHHNRGQPSSQNSQYKPKVNGYKHEKLKVPSSRNMPLHNQPKAGGISNGKASNKNHNSDNYNFHKLLQPYQQRLPMKRQQNRPEPKKVQRKQRELEKYEGYTAKTSSDSNNLEVNPNSSSYFHSEPLHHYFENEDTALQQAIMMSAFQKKDIRRLEDIPRELLSENLMSQTFYRDINVERQQAIYEEAQQKSRKRY